VSARFAGRARSPPAGDWATADDDDGPMWSEESGVESPSPVAGLRDATNSPTHRTSLGRKPSAAQLASAEVVASQARGKLPAKIVFRRSRRSSLPLVGKGMWASSAATTEGGLLVPLRKAKAGAVLSHVVSKEEEDEHFDAQVSHAARRSSLVAHEEALQTAAAATRARHRRMSVGKDSQESSSPRPNKPSPGSSGWWDVRGSVPLQATRRLQLIPSDAAALLEASHEGGVAAQDAERGKAEFQHPLIRASLAPHPPAPHHQRHQANLVDRNPLLMLSSLHEEQSHQSMMVSQQESEVHGTPRAAQQARRSAAITALLGQSASTSIAGKEVLRIVEDVEQSRREKEALRRVRALRRQEEQRRREITITKHLQHQQQAIEDKVRDAARMEAYRAEKRAKQDARYSRLMGSLATGSAMCQRLQREVFGPHSISKRRQLRQTHETWQHQVADRIQSAVNNAVESVPLALRRQQRVELSDAYNREAAEHAVFVGSTGSGKTGYNPYAYTQRPVSVGRLRDPAKIALQRADNEARQMLEASLPAAAAVELGMSRAAKEAAKATSAVRETRESHPPRIAPPATDPLRATGPAAVRMDARLVPLGARSSTSGKPSVAATMMVFRPAKGPMSPIKERHNVGERQPPSGASSRSSRPRSAQSAARALLKSERGAEDSGGLVARAREAIARAGSGQSLDPKTEEMLRAAGRTAGGLGVANGRWTLPPAVWTSGFIEDMPFVRNWPLPGDPRSRRSDAARGRGPTLGRKHDVVVETVERGMEAAEAFRERVLPNAFDVEDLPHDEASRIAAVEWGKSGLKRVETPSSWKRDLQDLLPIEPGRTIPKRKTLSGAANGDYEGGGFVVVQSAGNPQAD
jgi:hypothetical protein